MAQHAVAPDSIPPLAGLHVVEVSMGLSAIGAGMAVSLPGALLRDFGADVTRVQSADRSSLDDGVEFASVWDRGKEIVEVNPQAADDAAATVATLARGADVLLMAGPEEMMERRGLGYRDLAPANPGLVTVRIRPSFNAAGAIPDLELLLHARVGLLTQIRGHRAGPVFCDLAVASAGAALTATVGALARLYERETTGVGGWVETSLYDGLQAILPMIIGRVAFPSASTASLWEGPGPGLALSCRCADGDYVQLWFGAKGAYDAFLEHIGDVPSVAGYNADTFSGAIEARCARWAEKFASHDRSWWIEDLAGHPFRCEPVLRPGQALLDPHLREIGLGVEYDHPQRGRVTVLGPVARVAPRVSATPGPSPALSTGTGRLLSGVRVLDLSAYLAGPVTPQILAELGADVIKVEPATGDVHRNVEPLFAAGQRGKRALALDLKSSEATKVLRRLIGWSDVVHHNSRMGLAERLGYDEDTVRAINPEVVYSHASGFGPQGRRAELAANDHLMQALTGVEAAAGGAGQPPTFLPWGAIDVASGWVAASAILAALYARRRSGVGQSVTSSLLGAGLTLKAGAFLDGTTVVEGPVLDRQQTGYGATYRIYRAGDGAWFAVAVPDPAAWHRLRQVVRLEGLPDSPPALRSQIDERQPAEELLERVFATRDAEAWVAELAAGGVPVETVAEDDRRGFIARILDDPVNLQLKRVVTYSWGDRGTLEQPGFPLRFGPAPRPEARSHIPGLGEHSEEILAGLGFDPEQRAKLTATGAVAGAGHPGRPGPPGSVLSRRVSVSPVKGRP
jgi:crotonobetainyl-CoA:carnitine CoA-transferase CaiB-like acyl-CoA transferase